MDVIFTIDWDHKDAALAEKAWVGECGIQCKKATDCKDLDVKFPGMRFCCTNEGYCSTNCFSKCIVFINS